MLLPIVIGVALNNGQHLLRVVNMDKPETMTSSHGDARAQARRAFLKRAGMAGVTAAGVAVVLATDSKPALAMGGGKGKGKGKRRNAGPSYGIF